MSYGTYDNQSPLKQPFNPTADNGATNAVKGTIGMGTQFLGQKMGLLPGAQDPNQQQYFQQANEAHSELGQALKNIQGVGQGGKSGGGGMFTGKSGGGMDINDSLKPQTMELKQPYEITTSGF